MSATMAAQGGRVQLEQSDMCLALNIAKMTKDGFSCTVIEETKYLIKIPRTDVQEEKKEGVEFLGHKQVMAAIEIHPAMILQNHTSGSLPCQNGTAKNLHTRWRRTGTGAPAPTRRGRPAPHLPGTPPAQTGNNTGAQPSQIVNSLAWYAYSHSSLPCA